jgi:pyruvate/2-oxoglutarate dehydrogenase complex dihydrolipoamide acyltransferase (E2) component
MKMEHVLTAAVDGVLTELSVEAGQQVAMDEKLAVVVPAEAGGCDVNRQGLSPSAGGFDVNRQGENGSGEG